MKLSELSIVAVVHLIAFSISMTVIRFFNIGDPSLSLVIGACCGSAAAAMQYHRRIPAHAPFSVKASAGGMLSIMAALAGLSSQYFFRWMTYPDVIITISAIGSFFFPWAIFGSMQKVYERKKIT